MSGRHQLALIGSGLLLACVQALAGELLNDHDVRPSRASLFRHYVNLTRTEPRLNRLLQDFRWGRMDEVFGLAGKGNTSPLAVISDDTDETFGTVSSPLAQEY